MPTHQRRLRHLSRTIAILLIVMFVAAPVAIRADHEVLPYLPWSQLLPPDANVPEASDPARPCGADASPSCVDFDIDRLTELWEPLDQACDPRAVIALVDLRATQTFRTFLSDMRESAFYDDEDRYINFDRILQDLFLEAFAAYEQGTAPPAWTIAFDAALAHRTTAAQDVMLGVNAFFQRNMPVALAAVGIGGPNAAGNKADHDRHNEVFRLAIDRAQDEITERYDPLMGLLDASPSPFEETFALEAIKGWRERAWRNAERLASAQTAQDRESAMAIIDAESEAWAHAIAAYDFSWWWPTRDAHCRARHGETTEQRRAS